MTKQELLDDIRHQFENAINENYENFSFSLQLSHGVLLIQVAGACDRIKAFSHRYTVQLEPQNNPLVYSREDIRAAIESDEDDYYG